VANQTLDAKGLKCPQPALKVHMLSMKMKSGEVLEVAADCATFEKDMRDFCSRTKKVLLWIKDEPAGGKRCQIRM
jgi:tRNA 2-thiouridine synthesizing protein A